MSRYLLTLVLIACCWIPGADAGQRAKAPAPDVPNESYGKEHGQKLDLWKAKSDGPGSLVIYIHGGGFRMGDKAQVSAELIEGCLKEGVSVASLSYRLSGEAPFPAPMEDCARAVQYLRSKAKDWNLDPARFAATGESAGAGISLWLAFHEDLADPKSPDPILRQSTRLACAAVERGQTSYDRRFIKEHIGGNAYQHPALPPFWGLKPEEFDTEKAYKIYEACSPIAHLTADDPPVALFYPAQDRHGGDIHSSKFGDILKTKMDELKIPCELTCEPYKTEKIVQYLVLNLKKPASVKAP